LGHYRKSEIEYEYCHRSLSGGDRIRSMALAHEKLYRSNACAKIDFSKYARTLTQHLMCSYGAESKIIRLKFNVEKVFLDLDKAVPCYIILNELMTNCIKHAFPGIRVVRYAWTLGLMLGK